MTNHKLPNEADAATTYRKVIFSVMLVITLIGGSLFSVLNFYQGVTALALVELAMAVFSLALFFLIRRTRDLAAWSLTYLSAILGAFLLIFAHPDAAPSVFIWVLLIPLVSHLLVGRVIGLAFSLVAISLAGGVYVWRFQGNSSLTNPVEFANMAVCVLAVLLFSHVYEISRERAEARLRKLATTDNLTGLANRMRFNDVFGWEQRKAERERYPLSLVVIDLDHFKSVNDSFGHDGGDLVLQHVSALMSERLRATDLVCRMGGEEFGIMVPNCTLKQVEHLVQELQRVLDETPCHVAGQDLRITFSAGIAQLGHDGEDLRSLFSVADRRMYQSKAEGRNRVTSTDRSGFTMGGQDQPPGAPGVAPERPATKGPATD